MKPALRTAFEGEMAQAKKHFGAGDFPKCFLHLERAHILGQRHYWPHVRSHWWMLRAGWRQADTAEVLGQLVRIVGSAGSLIGLVPLGNTGRANVSAIKPMPIPEDLSMYFEE